MQTYLEVFGRLPTMLTRRLILRPVRMSDAQDLYEYSRDPEVAEALFEVLETERILKGQAALTLIPPAANGDMTRSLVAAQAISYGGQVPVAQGAGLKSNVSTSQGPSFEIKL